MILWRRINQYKAVHWLFDYYLMEFVLVVWHRASRLQLWWWAVWVAVWRVWLTGRLWARWRAARCGWWGGCLSGGGLSGSKSGGSGRGDLLLLLLLLLGDSLLLLLLLHIILTCTARGGELLQCGGADTVVGVTFGEFGSGWIRKLDGCSIIQFHIRGIHSYTHVLTLCGKDEVELVWWKGMKMGVIVRN